MMIAYSEGDTLAPVKSVDRTAKELVVERLAWNVNVR